MNILSPILILSGILILMIADCLRAKKLNWEHLEAGDIAIAYYENGSLVIYDGYRTVTLDPSHPEYAQWHEIIQKFCEETDVPENYSDDQSH